MALGNKEIMAENIKYFMDKKGVDRNQLCADLDLKYMTVSDWINAKSYPRIDKIELLANYFGISKSDLVESRTYSSQPTPDETPQYKMIQRKAKSLSVSDQERLLQLMNLTFQDVLSGGVDDEHDF